MALNNTHFFVQGGKWGGNVVTLARIDQFDNADASPVTIAFKGRHERPVCGLVTNSRGILGLPDDKN